MSLNKASIQDRRDLEKFIKFLALKSTQIVVQSRLGEKIQTDCNPHTSANDWFNIAINDQADVLTETKKVLQYGQNESVTTRLPLCVEISLQTVEGDKMILEVWSLSILTDQCNPQNRATHTIYNRMGLMLKSLLSVTRVIPAYKLSRLQKSGCCSYHIYYRIYTGEPQTHHLGDGHKQVRVGQLCTQIGTLTMAVAYRTKMTISPTTGRDSTMMLKSDHFLKDISPKHNRYNYNKKNEKKVIDLDKPMRCGAFVDVSRIRQFTEEDFILPETPPFSWLLRKTTKEESSHENSTEEEKQQQSSDENSSSNANNNNNNASNNTVKSLESNPVFRMSQSPKNESSSSPPPSLQNNDLRRSSRWSTRGGPVDDEKLLKELHFPFATNNSPIGDLAKFYRECFNAPPLQEFSVLSTQEPDEQPLTNSQGEQSEVDELTKQLEQFESSLPEYDTLISSICQSVDNNSNS